MRFLIVLAEDVFAPVAREVAPDAVDVIGVVLRIVKLDEERRALDAIAMALAVFEPAGPRELDVVPPRGGDAAEIIGGDVASHPVGVIAHERHYLLSLIVVELGVA